MTDRKLHLGISTCPNDTFAFAALLEGRSETFGLEFETELLDVQQLNRRLAQGHFDLAKGSFAAALGLGDELGVLPTGNAIGFGNGPVLLAREGGRSPGPGDRVLCPGADTTASLLYRMFVPDGPTPEQVVFSEILPALESGVADFGVCIHEGRFVYGDLGLTLVADLGQRWEQATGAPLPLGGIFARKRLGTEVLRRAQAAVAASLDVALEDPASALACMRAHAAEQDDRALHAHVELYVNPWTRDLGPEGRAAIATLAQRSGGTPLEVLGTPRLFHIAPRGAWEAFEGEAWGPPSLESEGFVHLSFAGQLAGTLGAHFSGAGPLVLLEVDGSHLGQHLRLEASRGGALFPHLYGPLPRASVLRRWDLEPGQAPPTMGWTGC
jgi:5,8-dihydroxy-2-naphthoate synthase